MITDISSARLGFAGTPEFAAAILQALLNAHLHPVVVFTQPDKPSGRGRRLTASPVKQLAAQAGIECRQPVRLRGTDLAPDHLDVLIVAAYGLILPAHILSAPRYGCINVHASLLPRWRGAAPIERAIMAGDEVSGISIMQMDEGLDTGPVYRRRETPITGRLTGPELETILAGLGASALIETLPELGSVQPEPQEGESTYAAKLTPADSVIDWTQKAHTVADKVRALCGRQPARTTLQSIQIRILQAGVAAWEDGHGAAPGTILRADKHGIVVRCGTAALVVESLQLSRGKGAPMSAAAAINGFPDLFDQGLRLDVDTSE